MMPEVIKKTAKAKLIALSSDGPDNEAYKRTQENEIDMFYVTAVHALPVHMSLS